jgi:succinate dehydrogenase / fumarate reductase cytochrome b subunit
MTDIRDALMVGKRSDGSAVRRPMSPHLQVYKPQITTVLSIMHRATGVAASVGLLLLTWWLVAAATSDSAYAAVSWFMRSFVGVIMLFGWIASLWYHFCNGIRHLAWDWGYGYELPTVHLSGRAVVVATAILTLVTWIAAIVAL